MDYHHESSPPFLECLDALWLVDLGSYQKHNDEAKFAADAILDNSDGGLPPDPDDEYTPEEVYRSLTTKCFQSIP